jgi:hypothetical protein
MTSKNNFELEITAYIERKFKQYFESRDQISFINSLLLCDYGVGNDLPDNDFVRSVVFSFDRFHKHFASTYGSLSFETVYLRNELKFEYSFAVYFEDFDRMGLLVTADDKLNLEFDFADLDCGMTEFEWERAVTRLRECQSFGLMKK